MQQQSLTPPIPERILQDLQPGGRTVTDLPFGGYLFLEHDVPYLVIYRKKPNDRETLRLARTGASYIIFGNTGHQFYKEFLLVLIKKMAARLGAFLLFEIYAGTAGSREFVIKGPSHKLPISLKSLAEELRQIDSRRYDFKLSARIVETKQRGAGDSDSFLEIEQLKTLGGTLIGLEVPPVYRDGAENAFPVYFRQFRTQFIKALQRSVFEFLRVQTTSTITSYQALGRREIHREVFSIDQKITAIQNSYSFLLLIAPVNIDRLRTDFFHNAQKDIGTYHYRLLPVDPDLLKRKLYELDIHEIDDPALAYIYDEKREELDNELTMLKERGSKNFFYSSMRMYKGIPDVLLDEAKLILEKIPENHVTSGSLDMDAYDFKKLAESEFEYFKGQSSEYASRVHIRKDINIMMVDKGELFLPSSYKMSTMEANALIQHEIGTHALTYYNGTQQPLPQLSYGLAGYEALQEGLAVLAEFLAGALGGNRMRTLAGRVVAGAALINGADFRDMFRLLNTEYGFSEERAFNITSRMFQGGGFLKDIVYLKGLLQLRQYLMQDGELAPLLSGKFALEHLDTLGDLRERGLLQPPKIIPRYLRDAGHLHKLDEFNKGMSLYKMVHI